MVRLYRGVCNVYEATNIILNKTIGGQTELNLGNSGIILSQGKDLHQGMVSFSDMQNAAPYILRQRGTGGERVHKMVNIPEPRPLIEYSYDMGVASGFGLLGWFAVDVDERYVEPNAGGSEMGAFCVSNANIHYLRFEISRIKHPGVDVDLKNKFVENLLDNDIELVNGIYEWIKS